MKKIPPMTRLLILFVILAALFSACSAKKTPALEPTVVEQAAQAPEVPAQPTPTQGPINTRTPKPTPTATLPPTETLVPSATATATEAPTATPTITPVIPVGQGTPLPQPPFLIAYNNADQLRELADYGYQRPWEVRMTGDAARLFVANAMGVEARDAATNALLATLPVVADCEFSQAGQVYSVFPGSAGQSMAICSEQALQAYSLDGQVLWSQPLPVPEKTYAGKPVPVDLVVSPDLKYVVFPATGGKSEIWDPAKNQVVLTEAGVNPVFSPDSSRLGLDYNGSIWVYNTQDWSKQRLTTISQGETKQFLPGGERLATINPNFIEIYLLADGKLERSFYEYSGGPDTSLFFSPDGQKIAWSGKEYPDQPLNVWNIADGKQVATLRRTDSIYSTWPQEFTRLANDGRAAVNAFAEAFQKQNEGPYVSPGYMACILDNHSEVPCGEDFLNTDYDLSGRPIRIVHSAPNDPYQVFNGSGEEAYLLGYVPLTKGRVYTPITVSPDQRYLLTSSIIDERNISWGNYRSELWNLQNGQAVVNMEGRVLNAVNSPDGRYLAFMTGTYTGTTVNRLTLVVFDFLERRVVFQPGIPAPTGLEPTGMAFLPQGSFVYAQQTSRNGVDMLVLKILDVEKWQTRREIEISDFGSLSPTTINRLPAMAGSADGNTLAVALADNRVRLFDLASDTEIFTWQPHQSQTTSLQFSPDGYVLGTLSAEDGSIKAWGIWP
jgi:WD40 repeat protein